MFVRSHCDACVNKCNDIVFPYFVEVQCTSSRSKRRVWLGIVCC
jgi:hypothetical protein